MLTFRVLITVRGGGHTIPGSTAEFPAIIGPVERAWDAAHEAVRFFERSHGAPKQPDTTVTRS